ncbi:ribonuclease P protein component [Pedobacter lusitanus]|uniref:ribonuclease P protein component n=1 Tax=Pedobacter lusitanus TaxID=1503925 RepID=UPI0009E1EDB3|nr:ribonuclease P protein component [Pedobacter lusitanus]
MKNFTKEERLCSRKLLDLLFKNGSSFLVYPYRVSYLFIPEKNTFPVQVVVNVSKKRFKRAHDRNLIKRRIREAYRLQKSSALYPLLNHPDQLLLLSLQFVGKEHYDFTFFEKKLGIALKKLILTIEADAGLLKIKPQAPGQDITESTPKDETD